MNIYSQTLLNAIQISKAITFKILYWIEHLNETITTKQSHQNLWWYIVHFYL